ncbi:MAG: transglutaminase family protein [Lachnospiraceae bacterium]|nr:transglutaminase family protein [Candidatus Colinaster scatohippi]
MAFLNYEYKMVISYSEPVEKCYFTIKSIPMDDFRQRSISYKISMSPNTSYSESKDSFGNSQIIGSVAHPHARYEYIIKGLVETNIVDITGGVNEAKIGMYKYPHGKCIPGAGLNEFAKKIAGDIDACASTKDKCIKIMHLLHESMTYEKGHTSTETEAEEAFVGGKGVCQDYAHIFITLLKMYGIPARYVCGLIVGQGESHAWVEAAIDGNFVAFDPTYDMEITDEYIKLGVGRDAVDCAINRGVMWGGGTQTQEVNVLVDKYY